ncbi:long-chain-fatty-acid--CoA ligase [Luteitalea sp. TBR-22]|uniref:long-chain-fatty-acid--CoA ligase n=1 Tax=Luteitalea sp. TBR-22 TaxID=2802971 RepID=UPI001AF18A08|nr:long-chain-fatty-acid--CoA ligase [Luteitalea sp. TBR-22]BCS31223.1 long-chain-fatty-acid--CoA ligase [Luteitalea sp. TBR-22]
MQLSVPALLRRAASLFPHKPIVSREADGSIAQTTYGACLAQSRRLAAALRALGVGPGDRVATFCWSHQRHLQAFYAVPALGAILHTLNVRLAADELAFAITDADDAVVIVDADLWPAFEPVRPRIGDRRVVVIADGGDVPAGTLDHGTLIAAHAPHDDDPDIDEQAGALLCHTSGTTGRPKGVLSSHRALVLHAMAQALPDMFDLSERSIVLPAAHMFHANAWGLPFSCALVGASQVWPGRRLDAAGLVELFASERVTHTAGVPTIAHDLLHHLDAHPDRDVSALRVMLVGGAALPEATIRAFAERHGVRLLHSWGMTETGPLGTLSRLPSELAGAPPDAQYAWLATQGRPAPLVEIRARAGDGAMVPWDGATPGELEVRGPWIASAYVGAAAVHSPSSADVAWTSDGWLRTGDVVTIGPTGQVSVTDRMKDLVKSGGEWISSVALEALLLEHPGVAEVAVIATPHERWGERPLAVVVPVRDRPAPTLAEIRAHLAGRVPAWWAPDALVLMERLPRTASHKVRKDLLRQGTRDTRPVTRESGDEGQEKGQGTGDQAAE